ncbi:high affinity immunoglobulin epsilon receptor subunit gamma [Protobothrops mucrosquamatus]|uniref:high affinity immunoglobulin epsilon receptor subunit gamma n=1 Tax=Protobothrops mucrosquamatus TaxID=103944 RepID=UPI000775771D|nr:high affinity immunoglobulin epsilon receptor subunit gamma [Protobothrops mucrosquamatus]
MNFFGVAVLVLQVVKGAEALQESQLCYILDGILFLYGILLTFLYCRLKFQYGKNTKQTDKPRKPNQASSAIYEDLEVQEMHPYDTLTTLGKKREELPPGKTPPEE